MTMPSSRRQGFTLVEIMVSLVIMSIIGAGLLSLIRSQTRFMDVQQAWRNSRAVSRSGLNRLYSDIRDVEATGGVEAAAAGGQDFTLRVPYAFGIMCSYAAGSTTLSLLPVDATMFAEPGFSGFAWRDAAGAYTYQTVGVSVTDPGTTGNCTGANVTTLGSINGSPVAKIVNVAGNVSPVPPVGSVFLLFRRVRYEFKPSVMVPGRTGLWRTLLSPPNTTEELAAPFSNGSRVNFYANNATVAQSAVPTLSTIQGFEFVLNGESERTPRGSSAPKQTQLTTSVFFTNRPD